ncbi:54S ribosomal protein L3 [Coelomomyces lativittatus]|nr:54S ribosomal protein L3 [Coelomomyces lativittatus]KAJ1513165.1 54S ribosomal protein L3 [Coelomomyces lativittatus]KAJ1517899.1 54S ribosomal protein L3 [Coelomomyces lativittatus]
MMSIHYLCTLSTFAFGSKPITVSKLCSPLKVSLSHTTSLIPYSSFSKVRHGSSCIRNYSSLPENLKNLHMKSNESTIRSGVLAVKKGMTAMWDPWGVMVPLTMLQLNHNIVTGIKTVAKEGYNAVQVGALYSSNPKLKVPLQELPLYRFTLVKEFQVTKNAILPPGHLLTTSHFEVGKFVDVQAKSIGKGFQGVMKRWGFKGQPATHGVTKKHRSPGSIGQSQDPSRVFKGKKMAGRMGNRTCTTLGLKIMKIDHDTNTLFVKGAVPGHTNCMVRVRDAVKKYGEVSGPVPSSHQPKNGIETIAQSGQDPFLAHERP